MIHGQIIYGANSDGYLFRFEPEKGRLVNLGKPVIELGVRAIATTADGTVYGAGGGAEYGLAHLFRYQPASGYEDLGQLNSETYPFGVVVRVACAAVAADGVICIGEDDDISHLWIYYPSSAKEE